MQLSASTHPRAVWMPHLGLSGGGCKRRPEDNSTAMNNRAGQPGASGEHLAGPRAIAPSTPPTGKPTALFRRSLSKSHDRVGEPCLRRRRDVILRAARWAFCIRASLAFFARVRD
jgi:hypothetical protein